jgi:hypothetical protein
MITHVGLPADFRRNRRIQFSSYKMGALKRYDMNNSPRFFVHLG